MNNAIYADPGQNLRLTRWLEFTLAAFHSNSYKRLNLMHLSAVIRCTKKQKTPQKDDIPYCKKEALDINKHAMGIYKEDRLVGHRFMTEDPMDRMS